MKNKLILILIIFNSVISYSQKKCEMYDCINAYLEIKGVNKKDPSVLIRQKESNKTVLRIFYGGDSISNYVNNYRSPLFNDIAWKELSQKYLNDTISSNWNANDFPEYNFIYENKKGLWNFSFLDKYSNNSMKVYFISEPLYYDNQKYILFEFAEGITDVGGIQRNQVVVMTKRNNKWEVVETIDDYILH